VQERRESWCRCSELEDVDLLTLRESLPSSRPMPGLWGGSGDLDDGSTEFAVNSTLKLCKNPRGPRRV
jgi:hypothetical protein